MFVPDLHSFTLPIDYNSLFQNTLDNLRWYIAGGINPNNSNTFLYRQSQISAHSELAWILSCFSYFGEMERMTQFKDKSKKHEQSITVGLFTYPILMAADILLYNANYIPVGLDQQQHIELARNLSIRINNKFGEKIFTVPEEWSKQLEFMQIKEGIKIRSLTNPTAKMSKSDGDTKGTIYLNDSPRDAAKKIMGAQTDAVGNINWDWENQPGITNILQIYAFLSKRSNFDVIGEWQGKTSYGDLKKATAGLVEEFLTEFQKKANSLSDQELLEIFERGEFGAKNIANNTLNKVMKSIGLVR